MKKHVLYMVTTMTISNLAFADANPYSFGGPCSSQGSWTQEALQSTARIREVTKQLKDDPNCKVFSTSMQATLSKIEDSIRTMSPTTGSANSFDKMAQNSNQISGLRSFISSAGDMKGDALKLMMSRSIDNAAIAAQVSSETGTVSDQLAQNMSLNLGARMANGAKTGISILNQVIDSIPQANNCLASPTDKANYIAGTISILASFLGSGQDASGNMLAQSISKMANYAREMKFTEILRKLNEREYMHSMSCLLEVTSETYCNTRDAMLIFQQGQKDMMMSIPTKVQQASDLAVDAPARNARKVADPFQGYYILTQHVPNITNWIQKIQIGVDPKLPTDAQFKNGILTEVLGFYQTVNTLLGTFEKEKNSVFTQSSLEVQQNIALNLIVSIARNMSQENAMTGRNFFLSRTQPLYIPFTLISIPNDQLPKEVLAGGGNFVIGWEQYLRQNYINMPQFKDPKQLVIQVGNNLKQLIADANASLLEYFGQWFIIDQQALVNESVTSMTFTVRDSLKAVDTYLAALYPRIEQYEMDKTSLGSIIDLRSRIYKILKSYEDIGKTLEEINNVKNSGMNPLTDDALQKTINASYESLIAVVYDQFQVMLARSGYLSNRLVTLVMQDYSIQLKRGESYSDNEEELMYATGKVAFDKLLSLNSGNPANTKSDLQLALSINKENIAAVELLFKDPLIAEISRLNLIDKGIAPTRSAIRKDSRARLEFDTYVGKRLPKDLSKYPGLNLEKAMAFNYMVYGSFCSQAIFGASCTVNLFLQEFQHSERYPMRFSMFTDEAAPMDTEFKTADSLKNQLCIQALAFTDWKSVIAVCKDANLLSPFIESMDKQQLALHGDYLSMNFMKTLTKDSNNLPLNHSERICAFRDYNRRNLVFYQTLGLQKARSAQ